VCVFCFQGPIIFDTVDFSPKVGKTTPKDEQIFAQLQTFCQSPIDHKKLYADLLESAADTTDLSIADILQKDVKQVVGPHLRLVLSSLPMNYSVEVEFRVFSNKYFISNFHRNSSMNYKQ